jgi:hypothetical protein
MIEREPPVDPVEAALADITAALDIAAAEDALRRLGDALRYTDPPRRATARELAKAALDGKVSAPAKLVDAFLAAGRPAPKAGQGRAVEFAEIEPWPEAVDGAALLQEIADTLSRYVALPPFGAVAIALWGMHAHALGAANTSPILALISPEKRCGKTTALSLLARLVPRPLLSSNISPASVFRVVEKYSPTLLVDEADTFLHEKTELGGILNSGHTQDAAYVVRTVGDDHEPARFSTWAAKAVALIGRLPDTLADRSIVVPMHRRAPGEQVERLRLDLPGVFEDLRRRAARWAADHLAELCAADPAVPGELGDRAADNCRPLLAIADAAGGDWPERARRAALGLSGAVEAEDGTGEQLLADIQAIFRGRKVARIFTKELLTDLHARDERPWREWRRGNPLTEVQLARLLRRFGIRPATQRMGSETAKGYALEDFTDAFTRYLPPSNPSHPSQSNAGTDLTDSPTRHSSDSVTSRESGSNPYGAGVVTGVTAQNRDSAWVKV